MNINLIDYKNESNFKAVKVATTSNCFKKHVTNIDIYEVVKDDIPFLRVFQDSIDFKKYTDLKPEKRNRWKEVFDYCIESMLESTNKTFLALNNNKICGILTYYKEGSTYVADGVCSIPVGKNKKVNYLGKTLFYHLFKLAHEDNARAITLEAVTDGPFDPVSKYESLGFKKEQDIIVNESKVYIPMSCNKHRIAKQLKELPFEISYKKVKPEHISLDKFI